MSNLGGNSSNNLGSQHIVLRYWHAYGGIWGIAKSPSFLAAIALTYFLKRSWLPDPCLAAPPAWTDSALSVLPNLLGFSLGGYLMWLGVGSESFRTWLHRSKREDGTTVYVQVSAIFLHFVCMQLIALLSAFIGKHFWGLPSENIARAMTFIGATDKFFQEWISPAGNCLGFFLFVYAMLVTFETAFGVFRISSWQDFHSRTAPKKRSGTVFRSKRHP